MGSFAVVEHRYDHRMGTVNVDPGESGWTRVDARCCAVDIAVIADVVVGNKEAVIGVVVLNAAAAAAEIAVRDCPDGRLHPGPVKMEREASYRSLRQLQSNDTRKRKQ